MGKSITQWGKECKKKMIDNNVSLENVSETTGYSRTYISAIINNRMSAPESTKIVISKALDVDPKYILSGQEVH